MVVCLYEKCTKLVDDKAVWKSKEVLDINDNNDGNNERQSSE